MYSKALFILLFVLSAQSSVAKLNCSSLLAQQSYTALDYDYSDLEGVYFQFVSEIEKLAKTDKSAIDTQTLHNALKIKASFLNDVGFIIHSIRSAKNLSKDKKELFLLSIEKMLISIQAPPSAFGIINNTETGAPEVTGTKHTAKVNESQYNENSNPIGFVHQQINEEDRLNRSIGFGVTLTEKTYAPPHRVPGYLAINNYNNKLLISDGINQIGYAVPPKLLNRMNFKTAEAELDLSYNPEVGEWIVQFKNLTNPSGHIGF